MVTPASGFYTAGCFFLQAVKLASSFDFITSQTGIFFLT
jgi:hypothetical protein